MPRPGRQAKKGGSPGQAAAILLVSWQNQRKSAFNSKTPLLLHCPPHGLTGHRRLAVGRAGCPPGGSGGGDLGAPNRLPLNDWKNSVSQRLQPGVKWTDTLLPQPYTDDFWMPIPAWLAGAWHSEKASFTGGSAGRMGQSSDYLSRHDDRFGCQRDKSGVVWHLVRYPFISVTEADSNTSYFIDFNASGSAKNSFHINLEVDDIEVVVSKIDHKIQEVKHRHDASSWIKIGTTVSVDDLMTVNGSRTTTAQSEHNQVRSGPLRPSTNCPMVTMYELPSDAFLLTVARALFCRTPTPANH